MAARKFHGQSNRKSLSVFQMHRVSQRSQRKFIGIARNPCSYQYFQTRSSNESLRICAVSYLVRLAQFVENSQILTDRCRGVAKHFSKNSPVFTVWVVGIRTQMAAQEGIWVSGSKLWTSLRRHSSTSSSRTFSSPNPQRRPTSIFPGQNKAYDII